MKIPEILLIESVQKPGSLAKILTVIGEEGVVVEHLAAVRREGDRTVWEVTLELDPGMAPQLEARINELPHANVLGRSDRVFNRHRGGKIQTVARQDTPPSRAALSCLRPSFVLGNLGKWVFRCFQLMCPLLTCAQIGHSVTARLSCPGGIRSGYLR